MLSHIPVRYRAGRASSFLKQSRFLTRGLWDSDRFKKEPVHDCFKKQQSSKRLTNNGPLRGASFETSSILRLIFSQFGKMVAPPFPDRTVPDWPKVPKNGSE